MKKHAGLSILKTKIKGLKTATKLQAREYRRRLDELNHAHAQATEDRNKFVTGELFYAKVDEAQKWRGEMDRWRSRVIGVATGIGIGAGVGGGLIVALIMRLMK